MKMYQQPICYGHLFGKCFNKTCRNAHEIKYYHLDTRGDSEELLNYLGSFEGKHCEKYFEDERSCEGDSCDKGHVITLQYLTVEEQENYMKKKKPGSLNAQVNGSNNQQLMSVPQKKKVNNNQIVAVDKKTDKNAKQIALLKKENEKKEQEKQMTVITQDYEKKLAVLQKQQDEFRTDQKIKDMKQELQREFENKRELDRLAIKAKQDKMKTNYTLMRLTDNHESQLRDLERQGKFDLTTMEQRAQMESLKQQQLDDQRRHSEQITSAKSEIASAKSEASAAQAAANAATATASAAASRPWGYWHGCCCHGRRPGYCSVIGCHNY